MKRGMPPAFNLSMVSGGKCPQALSSKVPSGRASLAIGESSSFVLLAAVESFIAPGSEPTLPSDCCVGFADGSEGRGIRIGTLVTAMRHAARSAEIAELAVRHRDRGVVGFDIA